jgi:cytochrome d ubiquinol oxidase subunit II
MTQVLDLAPICTLILALAVFFYVLLDGFDLGVGILYGFAPDTRSRNTIMNSIAPIWDGNETWLVLVGRGLLAAFPTAFAVIIPAVYLPILVMLLALVFRGVAFEFRFRDAENKTFWDRAFCYGSVIATFAQGVVLGVFIQGFPVRDGQFAGTSFAFLTPVSVLNGVALLFGYGLLGADWLILKTEGDIQAAARRQGRICLIGVLSALAIVSIWTPIMSSAVAARWSVWPNIALFAPVPVLSGMRDCALDMAVTRQQGRREALFWCDRALRPNLHRRDHQPLSDDRALPADAVEAASSPRTQALFLVGTLFLLPVILTYSGWSYWVFRGKVRTDVGYE